MTGFRDYMEPNVWVTAQTIYVLADAAEIRDFENYNYIDRTLINNMTRWLVRQQWQNVSGIRGAFNETSPYIYDYNFVVSTSNEYFSVNICIEITNPLNFLICNDMNTFLQNSYILNTHISCKCSRSVRLQCRHWAASQFRTTCRSQPIV